MSYLILGGGITGLSAAWFLAKQNPRAQITLLEKTNRLGGWIQTSHEGGFLFEKGPRTFRLAKSPFLLGLIADLGLKIITSDPMAQKRYLYTQGKLRSMRSFLPMLIPSLIREPFVRASESADESIYEFACRRFSPKIAKILFDPLTLGIYAGDIHKLSIKCCFPSLFQWEREKGSILRGLISQKNGPKGLFTLPHGMQTLIDELQKQLPIEFVFNCEVETIEKNQVRAGSRVWRADRIFSTLRSSAVNRSLWVVNVAFEGAVLPKKGFGYLVPTQEKKSILGMIWDSEIFPEQGPVGITRISAMLRSEEKDPLNATIEALQCHLGIKTLPIYTSSFYAENAIPQFEVGCQPTYGISVEDCIKHSFQIISTN